MRKVRGLSGIDLGSFGRVCVLDPSFRHIFDESGCDSREYDGGFVMRERRGSCGVNLGAIGGGAATSGLEFWGGAIRVCERSGGVRETTENGVGGSDSDIYIYKTS